MIGGEGAVRHPPAVEGAADAPEGRSSQGGIQPVHSLLAQERSVIEGQQSFALQLRSVPLQ